MSEKNKAVMRRALEEVVNKGKLDLIDELTTPDMIDHTPFPGVPPNREGVRQSIAMLRQAFPDLHITIEDIIAEGDKVVSLQRARGTHKGEFMGIPPTGKQVKWTGIFIFRIADGRIADHWLEQDIMSLMQQLGAIQLPG
jgi:steroid delta-isomerase-like uncharacterized protein